MNRKKPAPKALFWIESDPEVSPRASEAVRIAAGLAAWKDAIVDVAFIGPAAKALEPWPGDLVDGNIFQQHLPTLIESGGTIFGEKGAEPRQGSVKFKPLDLSKLSNFLEQYQFFFHY
jgi:hypothetical protein